MDVLTSLVAAELKAQLAACGLARRLELYPTIGSTNDEARRLGRAGSAHGSLVIANEQTRGRGRRDRRWDSPTGGGIYMSVLLRPRTDDVARYAAAVQLAAGISVAETVTPLVSQPVELVWPNDVFAAGLKIAGILVEAESTGGGIDFLVCGIGVNINQRAEDFDPELQGSAGSLRMLTGDPQDRCGVLVRILFTLEAWERVARSGETRSVAERFEALSPTSRGCRTEVRTVEGLIEGTSAGVSEGGALLLDTDTGRREIVVGEVERAWRKR